MLNYQPSIRKKITLGYYAIVAIIAALSLFTFMELRFMEEKIRFREIISEFFDAILEIRRFEKNYFLYGQRSDYMENIEYQNKAKELLAGNIKDFKSVATPRQIDALNNNLNKYKELMDRYAHLTKKEPAQILNIEQDIRKSGKEIITIAEDILKTERQHLQSFLSRSQSLLIFSILIVSILSVALGQILSRIIVRPLKLIEDSMAAIADGKFEKIYINSKDREIYSLTNAINKMLRELELRQRHLIQSEKLASLGTLLSGVAHELNNPLSNISSSCQILMEEIEEADIKYKGELLSQINEQTNRARNIVHSLLEFSRDKKFKKETLPLKRLFEETIRFVRGQIPANVEITLNVPDDMVILADKQRIQQAFLNLIKNAMEAVGNEGAISIRAKRHSAVDKAEDKAEIYNYLKYSGKCTIEDDTIDIEIRDTGTGIPSEILPKIFDPFFTTKDVGKGSGLGLFIVHEIIEEHDGCIAVDSAAGKGTTFFISLPAK
ncbi:MAG: ATP-binding protein [Nitrospirota bacterium]